MAQEGPLLDIRDGGGWITLNRPDAMNAIDEITLDGLNRALDAIERSTARSVVLGGSGRAFCAGADLRFLAGLGEGASFRRFLDKMLATLNRIEAFPKPVIAAVNGLALAGGLELVLCCDLVLAAASAKLGDAHGNYGLVPGGGGSVRLPRRVGAARAKYLMYTGEFLPATTLAEWGLVNQVVADGELAAAAAALVAKMADKSPLVLRRMKAMVDDGLDQPKAVALRNELVMLEAHSTSEDLKEGLAAFAAKRKPRFTGR